MFHQRVLSIPRFEDNLMMQPSISEGGDITCWDRSKTAYSGKLYVRTLWGILLKYILLMWSDNFWFQRSFSSRKTWYSCLMLSSRSRIWTNKREYRMFLHEIDRWEQRLSLNIRQMLSGYATFCSLFALRCDIVTSHSPYSFFPPISYLHHSSSCFLPFHFSDDMRGEKDSTVKDWKGRLQMLLARRYRGVFFKICYDAPKSAVS